MGANEKNTSFLDLATIISFSMTALASELIVTATWEGEAMLAAHAAAAALKSKHCSPPPSCLRF